ncbi:MAG: ABC transporter permease [Armatimonadetes bacterium]|nr:ABC transporter permease [Armatimonadota bacterium]
MPGILAETWRARELLLALTEHEIKTRYRRSFLGLLWSLLTPLYQVLVMTIVVRLLWKQPDPNYSVKLLCGLVPWAFFATALPTSCSAMLRARELVKRVRIPRQALPFSVVLSCAFHFLMSMAVLLVILLLIPVAFGPAFLFLPVLMLMELLMVAGLSLVVSVMHTFYTDVEYIITNLIWALYFLTPVIWHVGEPWVRDPHKQYLVMFNPMAVFCEGFRRAIIDKQMLDPVHLLAAAAVSIACFLFGLWYFRRHEWQLPEVI